jgi:hypothetical protein
MTKRIDQLFAASTKIKTQSNRDSVQYIINCGEVNAADTIRDDKERTQDDYEWLAIATIASCLSTGEYNRHVVKFFTDRGIAY